VTLTGSFSLTLEFLIKSFEPFVFNSPYSANKIASNIVDFPLPFLPIMPTSPSSNEKAFLGVLF
jgi:hypothetical protein